ncbi:helix-turn-helix domain-containing protein [Candidatus Leptofilum sp.]|uniref:helix-turn-helix domain-containing protein n=1 Tax=Candidatus Leptofilum sp. TaxID=3241576 RepID=UPI003B5C5E81
MDKLPLQRLDGIRQSDISLNFYRTELSPTGSIGPNPHRHTFNEFFFISSGSGTHIIDFVEYPIRPNTLFTVGRGQVHYWKEIEKLPVGFVILFEEEVFPFFGHDSLLPQLDLFSPFGKAACYLSVEEAKWFRQMMDNVESEFKTQDFGWRETTVSMLQMMLIRAKRFYNLKSNSTESLVAEQRITREFLDQVEQSVTEKLSIGQLAETIGVSVAHLTTTVRQVMGVSAGTLLRQRRVLEAKRLLVHTNMTIAEVAFTLSFADPSYFGRFFKRETKSTPRQFREQFKRKYQNV